MRSQPISRVAAVSAIVVLLLGGCRKPPPGKQVIAPGAAMAAPPIESGVYGFSGAGAPDMTPEGVIGECIWVFDGANRRQVAIATCTDRDPGRYRLVLAPGRYTLRGPGGIKAIRIQPGEWLEIDSVASLPLAP